MKDARDVPEKIRKGTIQIDGHEIMAFLADVREDGGTFVADDIFDAFGNGDDRKRPSNYIQANRGYLDALAGITPCKIEDLIGLRKDGRYWCTHQVAVNYAGWLNKRVQVLIDRAAIAFAKEYMTRCFDWMNSRSIGTQTVFLYNDMIDKEIDNPAGKDDGMKYGVMHNAVQAPMNKALGGPAQTSTFKQVNKVGSAMDAYDTATLNAVNLARSVTIQNVTRKKLRDLWNARDEARRISTEFAAVTRRLLDD